MFSVYGKQVTLTSPAATILNQLPANCYSINRDSQGNYFLLEQDSFILPSKIYGDVTKDVTRILSTYQTRSSSTGVLLEGVKGSGKTLVTKNLSIESRSQLQLPTLLVNSPYCGPEFNAFIEELDQPCCIIFDEFEKVYEEKGLQSRLLTLLDGVVRTQKNLYLFTANNSYLLDSHLKNRPGRIYYSLKYSGLTTEFIQEYCQDNLKYQDRIPEIIKIHMLIPMNFDALSALVQELNQYNSTMDETLRYLNIELEENHVKASEYRFMFDGTEYRHNFSRPIRLPVTQRDSCDFYMPITLDAKIKPMLEKFEDETYSDDLKIATPYITIDYDNFLGVDPITQEFLFRIEELELDVYFIQQSTRNTSWYARY